MNRKNGITIELKKTEAKNKKGKGKDTTKKKEPDFIPNLDNLEDRTETVNHQCG